jgi:hypothetical protein
MAHPLYIHTYIHTYIQVALKTVYFVYSLRVFENRVLRRMFGPKRDEVTGGWRKLRNGELRNLYSSPSIIIMIKSRRMRLAGRIARMGIRARSK